MSILAAETAAAVASESSHVSFASHHDNVHGDHRGTRTLMVCVKHYSEDLVLWAIGNVIRRNDYVVLLHATSPLDAVSHHHSDSHDGDRASDHERPVAMLKRLAAPLLNPALGIAVGGTCAFGIAKSCILDKAKEYGANIIIIGSHRASPSTSRKKLKGFGIGSGGGTVDSVLRNCEPDTAIVVHQASDPQTRASEPQP